MPKWLEAFGSEVFGAVVGLLVPALLLWISSRWMTGRYRLDRIAAAERDREWALEEARELGDECSKFIHRVSSIADPNDSRTDRLLSAAQAVHVRALTSATLEDLAEYRSKYVEKRGRRRPLGWTNDEFRLDERILQRLDMFSSAARLSMTMHELRRQHALRSGRAVEQKSARVAGRVLLGSWLLWYVGSLAVEILTFAGVEWTRSMETQSWPASQTLAFAILMVLTLLAGWLWGMTALGPGSKSWRWLGRKMNRLRMPFRVALQTVMWLVGAVAVSFLSVLLGFLALVIGWSISR